VKVPPPTLGQHTNEILAEIGYGAEDIRRLTKDGAI
jgi:succinate--hydroxymethylglutarate CoA-transferase